MNERSVRVPIPGAYNEVLENGLPSSHLSQFVEMNAPPTSARANTSVLIALVFFVAIVLLQYASGAYQGEFGSHPDEAAHVVTGLMVYDYLTSFHWSSPMRFAEGYYLHYPKVSFGHWPPVFYLGQALWMLLFGASRTSLLLLMASLSTLLTWTVYRVARQFSPPIIALLAAGVFFTCPVVQQSTFAVMAEIPLTYIVFLATLAFGRYLEGKHPYRDASLFALLASLAILTKANGLLLVLIPGVSLILTRRFAYLKHPSLWLAVAIVLLLCAPFYVLMRDAMRNGLAHQSVSGAFVFEAMPFFCRHLSRMTGVWVGGFALVGVWHRVIAPLIRKEAVAPLWAVLAGLFVSTWVFHVIIPSSLEMRYLLLLVPAVVLFMADGFHFLDQALARRLLLAPRWREGLVGVVALFVIWWGFALSDKNWHGYSGIAEFITHTEAWTKSILLVSSDPRGEGMLIAEVALNDNRPNRYVLRASKMLATDDWRGEGYKKRFTSPAEVMGFLERLPVRLLVIDTSLSAEAASEHHRQLQEVTELYPTQWRLVRQDDLTRDGQLYPAAIHVYVLNGHASQPVGDLEVNMEAALGRKIQEHNPTAPQ